MKIGLLSISGVRRSIRKELRQMDRGFYGCGFPHPGVECFIAQISKLLTNDQLVRMQYRFGYSPANLYGADGNRVQRILSGTSSAISNFQQMGLTLLAQVGVGKSRYV